MGIEPIFEELQSSTLPLCYSTFRYRHTIYAIVVGFTFKLYKTIMYSVHPCVMQCMLNLYDYCLKIMLNYHKPYKIMGAAGFEPTCRHATVVFKTTAFDRSAKLPCTHNAYARRLLLNFQIFK
jgi:hypothetical protein